LHESGYKCGNPACHSVVTLDIHHLEQVSAGGGDTAENLLPLCPNCHALHHRGVIPADSIRAWKLLLLTINEAYDRNSIEVLNALSVLPDGHVFVSGDGFVACARLISSGLVLVSTWGYPRADFRGFDVPAYRLALSPRGKAFLEAWRAGNQEAAVQASGVV